jgi:methylmalonyl-CoA/ethylmalonyl-CoA epimerase
LSPWTAERCWFRGVGAVFKKGFNPPERKNGGAIVKKMSQDWQLVEIGVVVEDLDKAISYYTSVFGYGPFQKMAFKGLPVEVRGAPTKSNLEVAFGRMGTLWLELIRAEPEDPFWWHYFQRHGEGFHHLCYRVKDLKAELAAAKENGVGVIMKSEAGRFALLDSNPIMELMTGDIDAMVEASRKK